MNLGISGKLTRATILSPLTPLFLLAITFVAPQEIQQGQVIRLTASQAEPGLTATFAGKDFPIFVNNGRAQAAHRITAAGTYNPVGTVTNAARWGALTFAIQDPAAAAGGLRLGLSL
mgnify:CR=1 FL=1